MGCSVSVKTQLFYKTDNLDKEDNLDYVFNLMYEGKYITNKIEMQSLSCVNKYLLK